MNPFRRSLRNFRGFLFCVPVLGLLLLGHIWSEALSLGAEPKKNPPPNIIFLLTDDQRWDSLGANGNSIIQTPNIDGLAREGISFRNAFVTTAICMTSRASILSGQYARRHGINHFQTSFSSQALSETYPGVLKKAGYRTGFIGKWGVGQPPEDLFDYDKSFPGQGHYFPEVNGQKVHLTSLMGYQALEFLEQGNKDARPFCLSISFKAPHVQDEDPEQFLYDPALKELYSSTEIPLPKTAADPKYFDALPKFIRESEGRKRYFLCFGPPRGYQEGVRGYYRLITGVDRVVGRIRRSLVEQGLAENTVIIFSSDHGFFLGERGLAHKWFPYEEALRVPMIVYDPRQPQEERGKVRDEMVLNIDIAPTLLELAGAKVPQRMQGSSMIPLVQGKTSAVREEWFYEHLFMHPLIAKSEGIRTNRWKYFRYLEQEPLVEELYDLENDPLEERNLSGDPAHAETLKALRMRRDVLASELR